MQDHLTNLSRSNVRLPTPLPKVVDFASQNLVSGTVASYMVCKEVRKIDIASVGKVDMRPNFHPSSAELCEEIQHGCAGLA